MDGKCKHFSQECLLKTSCYVYFTIQQMPLLLETYFNLFMYFNKQTPKLAVKISQYFLPYQQNYVTVRVFC